LSSAGEKAIAADLLAWKRHEVLFADRNSVPSFIARPAFPPRCTFRVVIAHTGLRSLFERSIHSSGFVLTSLSKVSGAGSSETAFPSAIRMAHRPPPSPSMLNK
jgi:hypothetical protein